MKTKLHIFKEVALQLSFTKAAENLFLSQPAISKAIRVLENEYKRAFFIRKGNTIQLTKEGVAFLEYTEKILDLYGQLDNHFLSFEKENPKEITFGASTTLANYIIPKIISKFQKHSPQTNFFLKSGNSQDIEQLILNQQIDFGIIEGQSNNNQLQYKKFCKDEIVLVTSISNSKYRPSMLQLDDLKSIPFVEREIGSGTRQIIYRKLNKLGIKQMNSSVILSSTEAIKNYLYYSNSYALLSINSVQEDLINNKLRIVDIKDITFERWFYFVSREGFQSKVMDYFEKLIKTNHN